MFVHINILVCVCILVPYSITINHIQIILKSNCKQTNKYLHKNQLCEQAGFRCGDLTINKLQMIDQLIEKTKKATTTEINKPLSSALVDYEKVSDYINIIKNI